MEVIPIHYKLSKKVPSFKDIKGDAEMMAMLIASKSFKGYYSEAYALAHCQVNQNPFAFFVVRPDLVGEDGFAHEFIINPQIIDAPVYRELSAEDGQIGLPREFRVPNALSVQEGCLSFPNRRARKLNRFDKIKVSYQIPGGFFGMKRVKAELSGLVSQIFQHEFDHCQGKNIFFEEPKISHVAYGQAS